MEELHYDLRFLNIFTLLQSMKRKVFSKSTDIQRASAIMNEFEDIMLNNMKILCFKAFHKKTSTSQKYTKMMQELKDLNKNVAKFGERFKLITKEIWTGFQKNIKPLLDYSGIPANISNSQSK